MEEVGDELVAYDTRSNDAHCLTPLAAAVFSHCDGRTTVAEMAELATARLGEPVDAIRIHDALAQLEERDLMAVPAALNGGMSRRDLMRRTAVAGGAAVVAPVVLSVAAPAAIAGSSATCANILCCPCCQEEAFNKEECCTTPNTVNCQCTGNRDPGPPSAKYCKPAGASAPSDAFCLANTPGNCASLQQAGASCNTCVP